MHDVRDQATASDTLKSQGGQICDLQQTAVSLQSDVTDHARRLDESKSAEETLRRNLTTASDTLKSQGGQIEALQQTATAITEHNGKTDAEIASLKRISPRNAYIIAGTALAISIVHLVLNACGVL